MTASLPVPNDVDPEEPDRHSSAEVVPLPAGATPSAAPRKPRPRGSKSAKKGAPRGGGKGEVKPGPEAPRTPPAIPGPPPPLPGDLEITASAAADIIIPPKPPLPVDLRPVEEPVEAEAPAAIAEAVDVEEPAQGAQPTAIDQPVVAEEPVEVEEPVAGEAAVAVAAPAAVEEPVEVEGPVEPEEPVEEPTSTAVDRPADPGTSAETDVRPEAAAAAALELDQPADALSDVLTETEVATAAAVEAGTQVMEKVAPASPAATADDVLVMRGVSKSFGGTPAVDAIDLTVPAGTFYGLVGPNGAGKTTTLSMIAGLLVPDRGTIRVGGVDARSKPLAAKKLMGVLPDRLRTFDRLTGRQLLYYYGVLRGLSAAVVESRTADLARAFDIGDALGRRVSDYSAGMLKKVMLAGAMIHSPRLLVLDEPFEAVDPVSSAVILDILSAYVSHGGTVILSSHGMELVERVCSRVAVIVAGQVLAEGTVDEVRGELTLEQRFVELAGGLSDVEGLEWLHTFSG